MRWRLLTAAVAGLLAGCAGPHDAAQSQPVPLYVAGTRNNVGASVAAAGAHVVVTWAASVDERTNVYAASSDDGGRTFAVPVRVNDVDGDARFSGEQAPRVAIGDDVVVAWVSKLGGSRVRLARSKDGGRTFLPATTPHADNLTGARGWTSLAIDSAQVVHTVWLDGRDAHTGMTPANAEHHMRQDIFQSLVQPDGTRVEARVATDVCFCCKTAVAATASGATFVAWRHVYPTNQ